MTIGLWESFGDAPMPAQQGLGCDKPACTTGAGERGSDGLELGPLINRSVDLSAEDCGLVA